MDAGQEPAKLPAWQRMRMYSSMHGDVPADTGTYVHPKTFQAATGKGESLSLDDFKSNFGILVMDPPEVPASTSKAGREFVDFDRKNTLVFDLVGCDAPVANALRRILLEEVPSMAIERVWIHVNTSIIPDEVLAHRLGLLPIRADPDLYDKYDFPDEKHKNKEDKEDLNNASNTISFTLSVKCETVTDVGPDVTDPNEKYVNSKVMSGDLSLNQLDGARESPELVHKDIILAKLRPFQQIEAEVYAVKGTGKKHAKWSPVSTAHYRLLPVVSFAEPITGAEATKVKDSCPMDVFDIEDLGGVSTLTAPRARQCTMCRECLREPAGKDRVKLMRKKDHFIFSIEGTGVIPPKKLFKMALGVLKDKCRSLREELELLEAS